MKKLLISLLLALGLLFACAQAEFAWQDGYRIIEGENGKYGLENEQGRVVLQPVYDEIGPFTLWPDYEKRCFLIRDGKYGWYPAAGGQASPCSFDWQPQPFSKYLVYDDRIWNLDGTPADDKLYARISVLRDGLVAVWDFTESPEKWAELADSWGGRMDYASEEATILNRELQPVLRLKCDYIDSTNGRYADFVDFDVDPSGEKWDAGYIDLNEYKELCRKRTNLDLGEFRYGYARVFRSGTGKQNLIDMTFEKVYPQDFDHVIPFADAWDGAYALLCNKIWKDGNITGYRCTLIDENLKEVMRFNTGTDVEGLWCNGAIIVNDGDYGLYYVHDMDKKLLLKGKYVGALSCDRVRYQNEAGLWGYISGRGQNVIPAAYAAAEDFREDYAAVQDASGRWMFIDARGENLFGRSWDYVEDFRNGLAYVRDETGGYMIDNRGEKVRPALRQLHNISDSYEPYAPAPADWEGEIEETYTQSCGMRIFKSGDGKYGVLDSEGKILAPGVYDEAEPPRDYGSGEYRILLRRGNRWGWVSTENFCDARWTNRPAGEMFAGLTIVEPEQGDSWGYGGVKWLVDAQGRPADSVRYAYAGILDGGMLALREEGSNITFVLDESFREVFSLECDGIMYGSEGLFAFSRGELWGYCDLQGNVIAEPAFRNPSPFRDGYAVVIRHTDRDGEQYGMIDAKGELVIPFGKYENIYGFRDGYCIIRAEDHSYPETDSYGTYTRPWHDYIILDTDLNTCAAFTGNSHDNSQNGLFVYFDKEDNVLIDAQGNELLRCENIVWWSGGYCRYQENGLYGFLDGEGKIAIPAQYKDAGDFGEFGLAPVEDEQGWKYINTAGETAFTLWPGADYPSYFLNGYATVDDWYINQQGEKVAPLAAEGWW